MTNITGVPAFGGGGFAFRQPPDPPKPDVPQIAETALNGTATYTKGNELPGQNGDILSYKIDEASDESSVTASERAMTSEYDTDTTELPDDILTGPTPAFQASVLEVELDLRNTIAEIAAKRTQAEDEAAIAPRNAAKAEGAEATEAPEVTTNASEDNAKDMATEEVMALSDAPSEAIDPEARLSGPAAVQRTPFDG
ncbi:hypothetical protein HCZ23_03355 [Celeribacter sp. HF31]|uniref:hypothetical protein n=1 Tax=Celeribacter sp. HF31 TaxID=2721558 RepID=UPI00143133FA|nr:hypothetical protein [Celeribacter sp. HF31]NIY78506.1 hypothetical protein [Celeribacter sp. HF31]